MNEQEIAAQLARPHGEIATEVGEKLATSNQTVIRWALEALALVPDDRVLEIGMAAGRHVDELLRFAERIHARAHPRRAHPRRAHPRRAHPRRAHPRRAHPRRAHPRRAHPRRSCPTGTHPLHWLGYFRGDGAGSAAD